MEGSGKQRGDKISVSTNYFSQFKVTICLKAVILNYEYEKRVSTRLKGCKISQVQS